MPNSLYQDPTTQHRHARITAPAVVAVLTRPTLRENAQASQSSYDQVHRLGPAVIMLPDPDAWGFRPWLPVTALGAVLALRPQMDLRVQVTKAAPFPLVELSFKQAGKRRRGITFEDQKGEYYPRMVRQWGRPEPIGTRDDWQAVIETLDLAVPPLPGNAKAGA